MPVNVVYLYEEPVNPDNVVISQFEMLMISLKSLVYRVDPENTYNIVVYTVGNVPEERIHEIEGTSIPCVSVSCKHIDIDPNNTGFETHLHKLNVLDLACKYFDRFIYLDTDTVILSDISDLYNTHIDGCVGGVEDHCGVYVDKKQKKGYINAGILLVDSNEVKSGSITFCNLPREKDCFSDQKVLNESGIQISLLPSAYNVTIYQCMYYGDQQVLTAKILHFAGPKQFTDRPVLNSNKRFTTALKKAGYPVPDELVVNDKQKDFDNITVVYFYKPDNVTSSLRAVSQLDQLYISISGIAKNRNINKTYNIYIYFTNDTPHDHLDKFMSLSDYGLNIHTIKFAPPKKPEESLMGIWISKLYTLEQATHRFNRFLFLDNDTVIMCDIADVFNMDLRGNPIGGVTDILFYADHYRIGGRNYINGGLYLVDALLIRQQGVSFSEIDYLAKKLVWGDEPAVNSRLEGNTTIFPLEYNMTPDHLTIFGRQQAQIAKILHFAGKKDFLGRDLLRIFPEFTKRVMYAGYINAIPETKIFLGRKFDGLGDAIMFGDVINTISYMCPYIKIDVCVGVVTRRVLESMGCDVQYLDNPPSKDGYVGYIDHVVYPSPIKNKNVHMLAGMAAYVFDSIPILNAFKPKGINTFPCTKESSLIVPETDYIVVPSKEKVKPFSSDKVYNNWDRLIELLSEKFFVVELNTHGTDKTYDHSSLVIHTSDFSDTAKLLRHARFSVTLENGLNHWACHNGGRTYCLLISSRLSKNECFYRRMVPIECYNNDSPEYVFSEIMKQEKR